MADVALVVIVHFPRLSAPVVLVFFGSYRAVSGFWLYWIDFTSRDNFMAQV